jgi:hypothetical protein
MQRRYADRIDETARLNTLSDGSRAPTWRNVWRRFAVSVSPPVRVSENAGCGLPPSAKRGLAPVGMAFHPGCPASTSGKSESA